VASRVCERLEYGIGRVLIAGPGLLIPAAPFGGQAIRSGRGKAATTDGIWNSWEPSNIRQVVEMSTQNYIAKPVSGCPPCGTRLVVDLSDVARNPDALESGREDGRTSHLEWQDAHRINHAGQLLGCGHAAFRPRQPMNRLSRNGPRGQPPICCRQYHGIPQVTIHDGPGHAQAGSLSRLAEKTKATAGAVVCGFTRLAFHARRWPSAYMDFPRFNARFLPDGGKPCFKHYVHIGNCFVDTPTRLDGSVISRDT